MARTAEHGGVEIKDRDFIPGAEWLTPQGYRRRWAARLRPNAGPTANTDGMWKKIVQLLTGTRSRKTPATEQFNDERIRESIDRLESGPTRDRP